MAVARIFVIVGGGQAGAAAAHTLRREGFDGSIVVFGEESNPPYERPPLSKAFLRGEVEITDFPVLPVAWYGDHQVELRCGIRVTGMDPADRVLRLHDGSEMKYDAVLVATGGSPRRLPASVAASGVPVIYLRGIEEARLLRERLRSCRRLTVVGAGFLGCELAATARDLGVQVTVVELLSEPLEQALGRDLGAVFAAIHRDRGVQLLTREAVQTVEGDLDGVRVTTSAGRVIESDVVVAALGIAPAVEWLQDSGVAIDNGVVVDSGGRAATPGVFAAGDVARQHHPLLGRHVRVEHFDTANKQGAVVARAMLGDTTAALTSPHWFWSDQYEHTLQVAGEIGSSDEVVLRGSVADRRFTRFHLRGGILVGAAGLDTGREVRAAVRVIERGETPDARLLGDQAAAMSGHGTDRHLTPTVPAHIIEQTDVLHIGTLPAGSGNRGDHVS